MQNPGLPFSPRLRFGGSLPLCFFLGFRRTLRIFFLLFFCLSLKKGGLNLYVFFVFRQSH